MLTMCTKCVCKTLRTLTNSHACKFSHQSSVIFLGLTMHSKKISSDYLQYLWLFEMRWLVNISVHVKMYVLINNFFKSYQWNPLHQQKNKTFFSANQNPKSLSLTEYFKHHFSLRLSGLKFFKVIAML